MNEIIKTGTEYNELRTTVLPHTQDKDDGQTRYPGTASAFEKDKYKCNKLSSCSVSVSEWLHIQDKIQNITKTRDNKRRESTDDTVSSLFRQLCTNANNIKIIKTDPHTCILTTRSKHGLHKEINKNANGFTNMRLQKIEGSTSNASCTTKIKKTQCLPFKPRLDMTNQLNQYLVATSKYSAKELLHLRTNRSVSKTSMVVLWSEFDYSKYSLKSWKSFCTFSSLFVLQPGPIKQNVKERKQFLSNDLIGTNLSTNTAVSFKQYSDASLPNNQLKSPTSEEQSAKMLGNKQSLTSKNNYTELLVPTSINQSSVGQEMPQLQNLKLLIGPYAQTQIVYVVEQSSVKMKEKGTSQVFKKKSQAVGTSSKSSYDTNSSTTATSGGRRAIEIESCLSFRIELPTKRNISVAEMPPIEEPAAQKGKRGKGKKKSLHRCLCTLSFPTDKKKKKQKSELASSQASQTLKKKGKKERAGKETLLKEKGSSSISKYKESLEIKPLPEEKKKDLKFYLIRCCKKCRFWEKGEKDDSVALKPGTPAMDISLKPQETGTSATSQVGKKKGKGKKTTGKGTKDTAGQGEPDQNITKKTSKKATAKKVKDATGKGDAEVKKSKQKSGQTPKTIKKDLAKKQKENKKKEDKKETGALDAGTQSRKSKGQESPPGATVYKESGSSAKRGKKQKTDVPIADQTPTSLTKETRTSKSKRDKTKADTSIPQYTGGIDTTTGMQYYQNVDNEGMNKQGVNIGSECSCSVEFYKMVF